MMRATNGMRGLVKRGLAWVQVFGIAWVVLGLSAACSPFSDVPKGVERDWRVSSENLGTQEMEVFLPVLPSPGKVGFLSAVNWDGVLDAGVPSRIQLGVHLLGPDPYQRNQTVRFIPASNTKLFTQALALKKLGADFRYQTRVWAGVPSQTGGVISWLTLLGEGDPSWGMSEFDPNLDSRVDWIAAELKKKGVKKVAKGIRFLAPDLRWWQQRVPEGWVEEDPVSWYGSLAQPFPVALGGARFDVSGTRTGTWFEFGVEHPVNVNLRYGSETKITVARTDEPGRVGTSFVLTGTLRRGERPQLYLPIHESSSWLRRLLIRALEKQGIVVSAEASLYEERGEFSRYADSLASEEVFELNSPPLKEILIPFMKLSLNQIGASLFQLIGARFGSSEQVDLLLAGEEVMGEFVDQIGSRAALAAGVVPVPGFFRSDVKLVDGSGISRINEVTTDALMALLLDLETEDYFAEVWRELPIAGVDGTLKSRMKGTLAEGVLRAKTGTLSGVYNLSGYVPRVASLWEREKFLEGSDEVSKVEGVVPFVLLSRGEAGDSSVVRASQDRVGAKLTEQVNPHWALRAPQ